MDEVGFRVMGFVESMDQNRSHGRVMWIKRWQEVLDKCSRHEGRIVS